MNSDLSDSIYLGITAGLLVIGIAGFALLQATSQPAAPSTNSSGVRWDASGDPYTVPRGDLTTVCLGAGCVPPIDAPRYVAAEDAAWIDPGDRLVGLTVGGEAYAFPLHVLQLHGVVNAEIGGRPIAVTYSPHSGRAGAFDRRVEGTTGSFAHSGSLYNGHMVLADRATGSLWSPWLGEAIAGSAVPARLRSVDAAVVRWGGWIAEHPDTRVLSRDTGLYPPDRYAEDLYRDYRSSRSVPGDPAVDLAPLHPKDVVHGVAAGGAVMAFRAATVRDRGVVEDEVGGVPVLLVRDRAGAVRAFDRRVNGTALRFEPSTDGMVGGGSSWSAEGVALDGPQAGAELREIPVDRSYWFAWKLFNPGTEVHEG